MGASITFGGLSGSTSIGETLARLGHGKVGAKTANVRRTGQPVLRNSYFANDKRATALWTRLAGNNREARRLIAARMQAAEFYNRKHKEKGKRNGPLGAIGLEVLRELYRIVDYKTGQLEPAIATLCQRLRRSTDAVCKAMKRLKAHGYLDWVRRSEPIDNPGAGPQVRQITNAYGFGLPRSAALWVSKILGNGPAPDCEIARAEAHKTELDGMLDTLSPREFVDTVASTSQHAEILARMAHHFSKQSAILPNGENPDSER